MVLHRHKLFSLIIAAISETILMLTSAEQMQFLDRVAPRNLKVVTSSNFWLFMLIICTNVLGAVGHDPAFFCADLHFLCRCSVNEPVGEVLKFTTAAALNNDVIGKS